MPLRDKPKLSERLKGKSGDDLINEIKKEFENNKKNWFSSGSPAFNSFKREGFPFDDDIFGKKSDAGIKSHLEDLAKKHPEFAGDLRCPPWGGSVDKDWDKAFTIPVAVENPETGGQSSESSASQSKENHSQPKSSDLYQHGLRNTVDIVDQIRANQKLDTEPKRSCSAPPATAVSSNEQTEMNKQEPKRFTSKIEITPVNPFEENASATHEEKSNNENKSSSNVRHIPIISATGASSDMGSPRMSRHAPPPSNNSREIPFATEKNQTKKDYESPQTNRKQYESPQMNRKQPQVHHIPIFVEGRKDPVMAKNTEEQPEQNKQFQPEQTPLKRKLDSNDNNAPLLSGNGPTKQNQPSSQEKEVPVQTTAHSPPSPPPPPPPAKPLDPMQRIQAVQQDVDSLTRNVEQFKGNSRTDKEYLYLDEMLTRNLIKLDTIEVEGNEVLRTARKNVIKSIQKSIALLESKVPSVGTADSTDVEKTSEQENAKEGANESAEESKTAMDVDNNDTKPQETENNIGCGDNKKSEKNGGK